MTAELLEFIRGQRFAVQASAGEGGTVQAALVGIAITDAFELVFDTLDTTRKIHNLRRSGRIAFVIGGWSSGDERTVQYEGVADVPTGAELERVRADYFSKWPDGRARLSWPGLVHVRVRPTWIRFSDYNRSPPLIVEFDGDEIGHRLR